MMLRNAILDFWLEASWRFVPAGPASSIELSYWHDSTAVGIGGSTICASLLCMLRGARFE